MQRALLSQFGSKLAEPCNSRRALLSECGAAFHNFYREGRRARGDGEAQHLGLTLCTRSLPRTGRASAQTVLHAERSLGWLDFVSGSSSPPPFLSDKAQRSPRTHAHRALALRLCISSTIDAACCHDHSSELDAAFRTETAVCKHWAVASFLPNLASEGWGRGRSIRLGRRIWGSIGGHFCSC